MSETGSSSRSSKRVALININDVESANDQPAEKIMKTEEEPSPSQQVLELQQKVAELEKDREESLLISRQVELQLEESKKHVVYLENIIDAKPKSEDDGRENSLENQVLKNFNELKEIKAELERKLAVADAREKRLVEEHQEKIGDVSFDRDELSRKLAAIEKRDKKQLEEQQEKIADLTRQVAAIDRKDKILLEEQQEIIDGLTIHRNELVRKLAAVDSRDKRLAEEQQEKIEDLSRQLAQFKGEQQPAITEMDKNIFELYEEKMPSTVPYVHACWKLRDVEKSAKEGHEGWAERRKEACKGEELECSECKMTFEDDAILDHFFSKEHEKKQWHPKLNVSRVALEYWARKLESIEKPAAATPSSTSNASFEEEL